MKNPPAHTSQNFRRADAFVFGIFLFVLAGCTAPTVNLATSEPLKVDIDMRLDVYQYDQTAGEKSADAAVPKTDVSPKVRRDNRMADIQQFKNNALVGEGHDGLLVIRDKASAEKDAYRKYIRETVAAENADRMTTMKKLAESQKTSLPEIQAKKAGIWRNRAFKGEWIEVPQPDGTWKWIAKEG